MSVRCASGDCNSPGEWRSDIPEIRAWVNFRVADDPLEAPLFRKVITAPLVVGWLSNRKLHSCFMQISKMGVLRPSEFRRNLCEALGDVATLFA
jgi:hypothetical protein